MPDMAEVRPFNLFLQQANLFAIGKNEIEVKIWPQSALKVTKCGQKAQFF